MATMGTMLSPGQVLEEPIVPVEKPEWQDNLNRRVQCPDCQETPPNIIEDWTEGNVVCATCGLVLETHLVDQRSEWRTFASDDGKGDDPSRVGKAEDPNNPGEHLQTAISFNAAGQRDRVLDRAHASIYKEAGQQHLEAAFSQIRTYCAALHLPNTTEQKASELYRKLHQMPHLRGKNADGVKLACILTATRRNKNGISYELMMNVSGVSKRDISRAFKSLKDAHRVFLAGKPQEDAGEGGGGLATSPATLSTRYGSQLRLNKRTLNLARNLAEHVSAVGTLDGRNPNTTAGACIYMASHLIDDGRTLKQVAKEASVNDSTIKGAYRKLLEEKDRVIKPEWLGEGKGDLSRLPPV